MESLITALVGIILYPFTCLWHKLIELRAT